MTQIIRKGSSSDRFWLLHEVAMEAHQLDALVTARQSVAALRQAAARTMRLSQPAAERHSRA